MIWPVPLALVKLRLLSVASGPELAKLNSNLMLPVAFSSRPGTVLKVYWILGVTLKPAPTWLNCRYGD